MHSSAPSFSGPKAGRVSSAAEMSSVLPPDIAAAWSELERAWQDPDAHRRFVALCAARGALPRAGQLYRGVRDSDPRRAEEAGRRLDAVTAAALAQLAATKSPPAPPRRRMMWLIVGACGFAAFYAVLTLLRR